jgi:hypothetical protein
MPERHGPSAHAEKFVQVRKGYFVVAKSASGGMETGGAPSRLHEMPQVSADM